MRILSLVVAATVLLSGILDAQVQPNRQRRQLQQQVIQRLLQNSRAQAGMTDEQFERYREVARQHMERRNELRARERAVWQALEGQMRPGVAADLDSLNALIDTLTALPTARAEQAREEQRAYAEFLTPIQRAQLLLVWQRFENNVQRILRDRPGERQPSP